jgi:hypothetical protein
MSSIVNRCPPHQNKRALLWLEGFNDREIGEIVGRNPSTIGCWRRKNGFPPTWNQYTCIVCGEKTWKQGLHPNTKYCIDCKKTLSRHKTTKHFLIATIRNNYKMILRVDPERAKRLYDLMLVCEGLEFTRMALGRV